MNSNDYRGKDSEIKTSKLGEIVFDYSDFSKIKKGSFLGLSLKMNNENILSENNNFSNCTTTFFERREIINENSQKVYLKHHKRTSSNLYNGNKPNVVGYILPMNGRLELKNFKEGEIKNNPAKDPNTQNKNYIKRNL